jgi:hypothetical protein
LRERAKTDPDAFALLPTCDDIPEEVPSFAGHPLVEWAAFCAKNEAVIAQAQREHPENGALWLAQAALQLEAHRDEDAYRSLMTAASKPNWNARAVETIRYLADLGERAGLPRLDAVSQAKLLRIRLVLLMADVKRALASRLREAAVSSDIDGFRRWFSILEELREAKWETRQVSNLLAYYSPDRELIEALGHPKPELSDELAPAFKDSLAEFVGKERAEDFVDRSKRARGCPIRR